MSQKRTPLTDLAIRIADHYYSEKITSRRAVEAWLQEHGSEPWFSPTEHMRRLVFVTSVLMNRRRKLCELEDI